MVLHIWYKVGLVEMEIPVEKYINSVGKLSYEQYTRYT